MLLSSAGRPEGPIPPETRRVAGLLAREKTGDILAHLFRRPYLSASEIARSEEIHIATAQRYLKELVEAGLVGSRLRPNSARATEEYWLLDPHITIQIDLEADPGGDGMADAARRIAVRDSGPHNVVYDTNPRTGEVEGLLILSHGHPRLVEDRIRLSATVGRFLAHLPYSAGRLQSVWDIMQDAGLNEDHLPEVLAAIGRLTGSGASTPRGTTGGDDEADGPEDPAATGPGSARPLDPEVRRIFRALAARRDRLVPTPPVAILEVVPFDPSHSTPSSGPDKAPPGDPDPQAVAPEATP